MSIDIDDVKEALHYLSPKDLKEVIATCNVLLTKQPVVECEFYGIVCQVLALDIGIKTQPLIFIKKNDPNLYKRIIEMEEQIKEYLVKHNVKLTKRDLLLFYGIICQLILTKIKRTNYAVTLTTFINFFKDFESSFENAFPGYASSGLIPFLVKSRAV